MGIRIFTTLAALALCFAGGSACAMDSKIVSVAGCTVTGADKLPAETGGADALCAAIASARTSVGAQAVKVDVRVMSPHMVAATQTLPDGRTLPEVKTARSDGPLARSSFDLLAQALAAQLTGPRG